MRLIDGDRLEDVIEDECFNYISDSDFNAGIQNGLLLARDFVQEAPTIDAVEVVRCKDCKHFDGSYPMCCRFEETFEPEDYCSFGEKKEVEE